jgi:hypothetical protein
LNETLVDTGKNRSRLVLDRRYEQENCLDLPSKQVLNSIEVALRVGKSSIEIKCQLSNKHFSFSYQNEIFGLDESWAVFGTCEIDG